MRVRMLVRVRVCVSVRACTCVCVCQMLTTIDILLPEYTELSQSAVRQRVSLHFGGSPAALRHALLRVCGASAPAPSDARWRLYDCLDLAVELPALTLEWRAEPVADMYADAVLAALLAAAGGAGGVGGTFNPPPVAPKLDRMHFKVDVLFLYIVVLLFSFIIIE